MKNTKLWIAVVVVAIIAIVGVYTPFGKTIVQTLGATPGPTIYNHLELKQSFTKGGDPVSTTTVDATIVLDSSHLRKEVNYISMNIGVNASVTTMASTSAPLVNLGIGESLEVYFYNASTSGSATATFAAGTGVDLQEDEGETVVVNGLEIARLTFVKKADTDVALWVEIGQVAD